MYIGPDRRTRRTSNFTNAVRLLLESIARRFGLRSLVLGDSEGLLVAAFSSSEDPEELAACAPLVARNKIRAEYSGMPLTVWPVKTGSGPLTFCAIGDHRTVAAATLMANRGVRRILG